MKMRKVLHNIRGQAMVEFVIVSMVLVVLLAAIQLICDAYIIKQKTIVSASYATWKLGHDTNSSRLAVENNINKYFFANDEKVTLEGGAKKTKGLVDGSLEFANNIFTGSSHSPMTANYTVTYSTGLRMAPLLKNMNFPTELTISSYHEVEGNAWNFDNTDVHEGWAMLVSGIEGVFEALNW